MIMNKHIGEQIKKAREAKRLKQEDMAFKLGISARQIQKYEDGEFPKFKGDPIRKIDSILGTNFYEMIYEQDVHEPEQTKKPSPASGEDLKDDLIKALKKNNTLLEQQVRDYDDLKTSLDQMRQEHKDLFALLIAYQERWLEQQVANPAKFAEALRSIHGSAVEDQERLLKLGIVSGTDGNSKS